MRAMWSAGGFHHCFAWGWGYLSKKKKKKKKGLTDCSLPHMTQPTD